MNEIFLLLILLQIKHWYVDFVAQTQTELDYKGIYGDWRGITHCVNHGLGTAVCVMLPGGSNFIIAGVLIGIVDAVVHYHIDWTRSNYSNINVKEKQFWSHLGVDQMAHQITYLLFAFILS